MRCPNWNKKDPSSDKDNQNNRKDEPNNRKEDCGFYLWEKHDVGAREAMTNGPQDPSLPRTPRSDRKRRAERVETSHLPTPNNSRSDRPHKSLRTRFVQSANESPTPQRYHSAHTLFNHEDSDLSAKVISLLQEVNIRLTDSTKAQLRLTINLTVETYEARIRSYSDSVAELSEKLAETDGSGSKT